MNGCSIIQMVDGTTICVQTIEQSCIKQIRWCYVQYDRFYHVQMIKQEEQRIQITQGVRIMDDTKRQITKIAREVNAFTVRTMKEDGIGTAEFDFIHVVRHHPGITQAGVREILKMDKGAAARRVASLEAKGYLIRQENPDDGRSQLLFATEKAETLKNSKVSIESAFYEWLAGGTVGYGPERILPDFE